MPTNPPIHNHFCPDCNARYQCSAIICTLPDAAPCESHDGSDYNPWAEHTQEEVRRMEQ